MQRFRCLIKKSLFIPKTHVFACNVVQTSSTTVRLFLLIFPLATPADLSQTSHLNISSSTGWQNVKMLHMHSCFQEMYPEYLERATHISRIPTLPSSWWKCKLYANGQGMSVMMVKKSSAHSVSALISCVWCFFIRSSTQHDLFCLWCKYISSSSACCRLYALTAFLCCIGWHLVIEVFEFLDGFKSCRS